MTKTMMNDTNKEKDDSVVPASLSSCCIGRGSPAILSYDGTDASVPFRPVTVIVGIVAVVIILL